MKPVILLLGAALLVLFSPAIMDALTDFRAASQTDQYNVTTGVGETTATVTLTQDLYDDETASVDSITSNSTSDTPNAYSYNSGTNVLTVSGLIASTSRRLTIDYKRAQLSNYWGADTGARVVPMLFILGIFGIVGAAVYGSTRRGD